MKSLTMSLLVVLVACRSPTGVRYTCTDVEVMGIRLTVLDSTTGAAISGSTIRAIAMEGSYADTVEWTIGSLIKMVGERPGTYALTVAATGYQPWLRQDIRVVMEDQCHVRPVSVTAMMQRASGP